MPFTPALGPPLPPVPLMSVHAVPPLRVCQTCPTLTPAITTQASLVLAGLNVMPPIHPFGLTMFARLKAGRLPVLSVQVGEAAVALVLMKTFPSRLAVITTFAFDGPVVISCSLSVKGVIVVPKVRSLLIAFQLPPAEGGPGGTPPLVELQTRLVPAKRRWALEGSMTNGAVNAVGSLHAGSGGVELARHRAASTNEPSRDPGSPARIVELPRARAPNGVAA